MTDIFLERNFESPISPSDVMAMSDEGAGCFSMHKVGWRGSLLSTDGYRLFCWFRAPDMESARIAMRQLGVDISVFWRGTVHDAPGLEERDIAAASILVERSFDQGVELQEIQDIEDAGIGCLEMRDVRFIRTCFSQDRKRMICLYEAPDAESVRQAQREAGVPFNEVWPFLALGPAYSNSPTV